MHEGALPSFALYDQYHTNTADEQRLTSEIRSRIEYLIPSGTCLIRLAKNIFSLAGLIRLIRFNMIY